MSDHDPRLLEAAKRVLRDAGKEVFGNEAVQNIVARAREIDTKNRMHELLCKFFYIMRKSVLLLLYIDCFTPILCRYPS